jgi:chlorobactene glucosyltransferase
LFEGVGGSPVNLGAFLFLYLLCFVAPYLALIFALVGSPDVRFLLGPALFGVGANVLLRTLLAIRFRQPWEGVILHPISVLALSAIALNSLRWSVLGTNEWAGRRYASRTERLRLRSALPGSSTKFEGGLDA